jgi:hypothetical protein
VIKTNLTWAKWRANFKEFRDASKEIINTSLKSLEGYCTNLGPTISTGLIWLNICQ